ncbi:hypothetical protein M413DRAFT_48431, partial [Hebeloma cylindrosporum]
LPTPTPSLPEGEKLRDKKQSHANRRKKRRSQQAAKPGQPALPQIRPSIQKKYMHKAMGIQTGLETEKLPAASTAYVANHGLSGKKVYRLEELVGKDAKAAFKLVQWDGKTATPITDSVGRIVALLAGHPDDPSWDSVHSEAAELLEQTRPHLSLNKKAKKHRRGHFGA